PGTNQIRVFPKIKAAETNVRASAQLHLARKRIRDLEASLSWRVTKPLRWIRGKLARATQQPSQLSPTVMQDQA
ncbi:hypothetical protein, partial [Microvirga roseola]|uniref:hypothetical protein n=1 Tax=Microvirga roseola TaxID=2883126 RepID=UPI001E2C15EA